MDDCYETTIQSRAEDFLESLDGAGRVTVHTPNALGDWDTQSFSPEVIKHILRNK